MMIIERALEIARSRECATLEQVAKRLKQDEHFSVEEHLAGPSIRKKLNVLIAEARRRQTGG
jgi:hypothetical protein